MIKNLFKHLLICALICGCKPVNAQVSTVKISTIGLGWANNSVNTIIFRKNSLVTFKGEQYAAYYNNDQYIVLAKRKNGTVKWQTKLTSYKGDATDAHKDISIMVDGAGYLHMACGLHNQPLNYVTGIKPGSLTLSAPKPMTGIDENRVSYPVPVYSNWILFSGMVEAFFCKYDLGDDPVRTEYGIREFTQHWYVGDGMFSDGMSFHLDYYNSIVIQPYLGVILQVQAEKKKTYQHEEQRVKFIGQRYAEILERLINADGSYPVIGRSIVYRAGVFHHLANMAYAKQLPASLPPAQVRCALTAVIKKTLESSSTFTADGWLSIGLYGKQPGLADFYITTGSLYICSNVFVPLGLPETDEFWTAPPLKWTEARIWSGEDVSADHALDIK